MSNFTKDVIVNVGVIVVVLLLISAGMILGQMLGVQ